MASGSALMRLAVPFALAKFEHRAISPAAAITNGVVKVPVGVGVGVGVFVDVSVGVSVGVGVGFTLLDSASSLRSKPRSELEAAR